MSFSPPILSRFSETVGKNLNVKDQVASAAKKATLRMIKRNFEYINKDAFEVLYGTLVRPQLEYAVHLWSPYQIGLRENQSGHKEEQQNW